MYLLLFLLLLAGVSIKWNNLYVRCGSVSTPWQACNNGITAQQYTRQNPRHRSLTKSCSGSLVLHGRGGFLPSFGSAS